MSDPIPIVFIADPENLIPEAVKEHWREIPLQWIPFSPEKVFEGVKYWVLFAPYLHRGYYQQVEWVWKRYLEVQDKNARLIIIGSVPGRGPNYIDVLELPEDPLPVFKSARTAGEPWEPVYSGGMDMREKLQRFIDGHSINFDPDQSVRQVFRKMRAYLKNYHEHVKDGLAHGALVEVFESLGVERQLNAFLSRWERYYPLFGALPFSTIFVAIDNAAQNLKVDFDQAIARGFDSTRIEDMQNTIDDIYNRLLTVENYVRTG